MLARTLDFMRKLALPADAVLLVGVSGGPDSLALLDVLQQAKQPVIAAHFNHHLRPESGQEAAYVAQLTAERGVRFINGEADTPDFAKQNSLSIEEAARILRYRFLFKSAEALGVQAVAVAHTADDQVETVLMHLLRGAGLAGLRGMQAVNLPNEWSEAVPLVRLLLGTWRTEVLAYCRENGLQPIEDASNQQTKYYRNRIRHELVPVLESYNPQARRLLWQTADNLAQDYELISALTGQALKTVITQHGDGYLGCSGAGIRSLHPGLQRQVWRRLVAVLRPGLRDVGYDLVLRAVEFASQPDQPQAIDLTSGLRLMREGETIWLFEAGVDLPDFEWPKLASVEPHLLPVPGEMQLQHGWRLSASLISAGEAHLHALANQDVYQAWLDAGAFEQPLQVKARLPGEHIAPLGMGGKTVKISDLMINEKLPQRARANWPVVSSGGLIVWVPGYSLSHHARLKEATRSAIHLRLQKS